MEKKKKKISKFGIGIIIYTIFLAIAIVVVDVYLYKAFAAYQKEYEKALSASDPDDYVEKYLRELDKDTILKLLEKDESIVYNGIDAPETTREYIASLICSYGELRARRDDQWKENVPIYKLYYNEKEVGLISFKRIINTTNNKPDTFIVANAYFGQYLDTIPGIKVIVRACDTLCVNGNEIPIENARETRELPFDRPEDYPIGRQEAAYYLTGFYAEPEIKVYDKDHKEIIGENGDYSRGIYEGFEEEAKRIAEDAVFRYLRYYNLNIEYKDYVSSLPWEGNVRDLALSVKEGIKWREKAVDMNITNTTVDNLYRVGEDCFCLDITIDYHMKFEKYSGNDSASYECIFVRRDGNWIFYHMAVK